MSNKKTSIDENFPDRLRELIENKLDITQSEFAKKLGITAGYVSMVITGKRGPSAELIAGLYLYYSEYINWVLTGKTSNHTIKLDNQRKFSVLNEIEEWLAKEVKMNPKNEAWFEMDFEKKFEGFKKWKEEKEESEAREASTSTRKVA